ncbi:hypothetical protein MKW94_027264 [Papaver nudicaule]|uniref:PLAT domain-containing protein n=1 Tax=Papaver nudicaule TaxID=74823 RepID=A0AA41V644_PAPNU|nr:hypothetical protein [Papaver nudicaule]
MAASKVNHVSLFLVSLLLLSLAFICQSNNFDSDSDDDCVYTVYIRTSSIIKGGTDSKISLTLYNKHGKTFNIPNIETWGGLMEPGHDYFERGNLDIFSGRGDCFEHRICGMILTSDGTGWGHGWYVNYVELTTTGKHKNCHKQLFTVEQWLATDTYPWNLTAVRDNCDSVTSRLSYSKSEELKPELNI